jgi:rod shape-determining protein MreC
MKRRVLDYSLAGALLLIPVIVLHSNLKNPSNINGFDRAVLRVSSPLQAVASWVVGGFGGTFSRYVWLVDVEDAALKRQVADTKVREEMVGLRERTPADTVGGRVIAASVSPYFRVMRISVDRGDSEVDVDMPVITSQGLVGRINNVYGPYSDVLLISDGTSKVDVTVERTGGRGMLQGLGKNDTYACAVEKLDRIKQVEVGDLVVTSGLDRFPAGVPVGTVSKVTTKDYEMYQKVEVEPVVNLSSLRNVMVLQALPPPADPNAAKRRKSVEANGAHPY